MPNEKRILQLRANFKNKIWSLVLVKLSYFLFREPLTIIISIQTVVAWRNCEETVVRFHKNFCKSNCVILLNSNTCLYRRARFRAALRLCSYRTDGVTGRSTLKELQNRRDRLTLKLRRCARIALSPRPSQYPIEYCLYPQRPTECAHHCWLT